MKKFKMEIDLETIVESAIEKTIANGLKDDEDIIEDKSTFKIMQTEYRLYGALFGMNFKNNLEEIFEQVIREEKENL